jgi:hypothetical protein
MLQELRKMQGFLVVFAGLRAVYFYFAIADLGSVNPILSSIGGLVTEPLFLFFGFGFLIGGIHLTTALVTRFNKPRLRETSAMNNASEE